MEMLLGLVPVLPPPCGWEHRMAGRFSLGWQISLSLLYSGHLFSSPHTFNSLLVSGVGFHCSWLF